MVNPWSSALGLDLTINSIVCERHFKPEDIIRPSLLINDEDRKLGTLKPLALPVRVMNAMPESRTYCTMPGCTTNIFEKVEDITFFSPQNVIFITIHKYYFKLIIDVRSLLFLMLIL